MPAWLQCQPWDLKRPLEMTWWLWRIGLEEEEEEEGATSAQISSWCILLLDLQNHPQPGGLRSQIQLKGITNDFQSAGCVGAKPEMPITQADLHQDHTRGQKVEALLYTHTHQSPSPDWTPCPYICTTANCTSDILYNLAQQQSLS